MSDEPIDDLARLARERRAPLDPRWEALTRGELDEAERAALLAGDDAERLAPLFEPLGDAFADALTARLLGAAPAGTASDTAPASEAPHASAATPAPAPTVPAERAARATEPEHAPTLRDLPVIDPDEPTSENVFPLHAPAHAPDEPAAEDAAEDAAAPLPEPTLVADAPSPVADSRVADAPSPVADSRVADPDAAASNVVPLSPPSRPEAPAPTSARPWLRVAGPLVALAAAALLAVGLFGGPDPLPAYVLEVQGGDRDTRAGAAPAAEVLRLSPGSRVTLVARPAEDVAAPVVAEARIVRADAAPIPWGGAVEVSPSGAVRLAGTLGADVQLPPGEAVIELTVHPRGEPDEARTLTTPILVVE